LVERIYNYKCSIAFLARMMKINSDAEDIRMRKYLESVEGLPPLLVPSCPCSSMPAWGVKQLDGSKLMHLHEGNL